VKVLKSSTIVRVGLIAGALCASTIAYGTQPPDVVASDATANTAVGTGALADSTPTLTSQCNPGYSYPCYPYNFGGDNTGVGFDALTSNTVGERNTAIGSLALFHNETDGNTAVGYMAMLYNATGTLNTAVGFDALMSNTTAEANTAMGYYAMANNTTGYNNTAFGADTLTANSTGNGNTALGALALSGESGSASNNTAVGADTLSFVRTGSGNTATGQDALNANFTGDSNVAVGVAALALNTTGSSNNALGLSALQTNISGSYNVAVGDHAGYYTSGSNNVEIANHGVAGENNTIRIGTVGTQKTAFVAGVYGTPLTGAAVVVTSTGQLGVVVSSERYKTDITPIGDRTSKLERLRPVTFHLKSDPNGPLQYGLIAEEVAKVYPDLVVRDDTGRIDGVRYDELAPMLLGEMQQQTQVVAQQAMEIQQLKLQMAQMQALTRELQASVRLSLGRHALVAAK
jgi:Chaperone of endosialidase